MFDELPEGGGGHPQTLPAEVVAQEIKALFGPANECLRCARVARPRRSRNGNPAILIVENWSAEFRDSEQD